MYLFASTRSGADLHVYTYIAPFLRGNDFTRATAKGHWKSELQGDVIKFSLSGSLHWDLVDTPLWFLPNTPARPFAPVWCSSLFPTCLHAGLTQLLPGSSRGFPSDLDYHLVKCTHGVLLICPQKSIHLLHAWLSFNPFLGFLPCSRAFPPSGLEVLGNNPSSQ